MTSLLTQHDLERWLGATNNPSHQLGLSGSLFEASLRLLRSIAQEISYRDELSPHLLHGYTNEIERFFLWGDGFSAGEGGLDSIVERSKEIRTNVIMLLYETGIAVQCRHSRENELANGNSGMLTA